MTLAAGDRLGHHEIHAALNHSKGQRPATSSASPARLHEIRRPVVVFRAVR